MFCAAASLVKLSLKQRNRNSIDSNWSQSILKIEVKFKD
jgi:hypothetical protein